MSGGLVSPWALERGRSRTLAEVVNDHLLRWRNRDLDGDLARNYDPAVLTVTPHASFVGWSGPRTLEAELEERVPGGHLAIGAFRLGQGVAVVSWTLGNPDAGVGVQGVDSLFVRHGRILTQTREVG